MCKLLHVTQKCNASLKCHICQRILCLWCSCNPSTFHCNATRVPSDKEIICCRSSAQNVTARLQFWPFALLCECPIAIPALSAAFRLDCVQVRVKAEQAAAIQPKIDFTSRGEGRLDLGFGAERKQQGMGELASGLHSWPALRACGEQSAAHPPALLRLLPS